MKCGMNAHRIFYARLLNVFLSLKIVMGSIIGRVGDCMKQSLWFFLKPRVVIMHGVFTFSWVMSAWF